VNLGGAALVEVVAKVWTVLEAAAEAAEADD